MLLITKNTTNKQVLTLSEKTTLQNVVYLFEVINDQSEVSKCFIAQDISANKIRYNRFDIVENVIENLLIGKINLQTGFYKYNVYEQTNTTNLNPLNAINFVDCGKLKVIDIEVPTPEFTGTQTDYVVYGG